MGKSVFILGAGASCEAGAPLMKDFLDAAEDLARRDRSIGESTWVKEVFDALYELRVAHHKAAVDLDNLEAVFAAFEMARLVGRLGGLPKKIVRRLPMALTELISHTLLNTVRFPIHRDKGSAQLAPPASYESFVGLLGAGKVPNASDSTIITFNYDLCLDYALAYCRKTYSYCLGNEVEASGVRLLKLHGSLNWYRCPACRQIVPWDFCQKYASTRFGGSLPWGDDTAFTTLREIGVPSVPQHCGQVAVGPVIVPPTWSKAEYHRQIETVWREAANALMDAENVYVFGYSLPETDQFFRYLYAVGSIGRGRIRRFWVFDPSAESRDRFRDLLGQGAADRFRAFPYRFHEAITAMGMGPDQYHAWQDMSTNRL